MVAHLFFYPLVLMALLWLFILLHLAWPSRVASSPQRPAEPKPIEPKRTRSAEPQAFAGRTQKPPCPRCASDSDVVVAPPVRPDPMPATHRRPRIVDTSPHFCPQEGWATCGPMAISSGGPWRQLHCLGYKGFFLETHGTIFHGKQSSVERIVHVLACLAEGLGIRATARVFEIDPHTVLQGLVEATEQLQASSAYFLCDVHVNQLQLDELYAVLREVKAGELSDAEAIKRLERSPYWVWTAMDPESKLLLVMDVGMRTLEMAQRAVHQVAQVLAPGCVPLVLTDGLKDYGTALLAHFGQWMQPPRRQDKGPLPKPRWIPLPQLLYAQVVKSYRRRRLVGVKHRVVFGTFERVQQVLSACGWQINTAFVERLNLDIRQRVAAVGRRVNTLCQGEDGVRQQLALYHVYH